jgi:hypothetical protein
MAAQDEVARKGHEEVLAGRRDVHRLTGQGPMERSGGAMDRVAFRHA